MADGIGLDDPLSCISCVVRETLEQVRTAESLLRSAQVEYLPSCGASEWDLSSVDVVRAVRQSVQSRIAVGCVLGEAEYGVF